MSVASHMVSDAAHLQEGVKRMSRRFQIEPTDHVAPRTFPRTETDEQQHPLG
jgi:hypothetical protein